MELNKDPPVGYSVFNQHSPVTAPWAPVYVREESGCVSLAIRVAQAHCNSRALVHGGLLCAVADLAMGRSALVEVRRRGYEIRAGLTTSLNIDFLESAAEGELLEWVPEVLRVGKALSVVECRILSGDRLVARANATFKMVG